jgi:hypothetical protein
MNRESSKLIWKRIDGTFDLKVNNVDKINVSKLKKLLEKVEASSDYNKPFSKDASKYFQQWFTHPNEPLKEAAYCLLSNWFLTECPASKSIRAFHAINFWDALFCKKPKERLTDWTISGSKVVPERFAKWWIEQQGCQERK